MYLLRLILPVLLFTVSLPSKAQYYFIFKARKAGEAYRDCDGTQHRANIGNAAFVSLVRRSETTQQTIVDSTWAFVPNSRSKLSLIYGKGKIESTCLGDVGVNSFVIEVDRVTYEYAKRLKSKWENNKQYGYWEEATCVDFVRAMLELVTPELKLPEALKRKYLYPPLISETALVLEQWNKFPGPFFNYVKSMNLNRDKASRQSLFSKERKDSAPNQYANSQDDSDIKEQLDLYSNIINKKNSKSEEHESVNPVTTPHSNKNLLGAATPEELAKLLLKCLKTKDKATWMRCLHPDDSVETDEVSSRKFDRHREKLISEGITDWSSVQYSRLTYPLRPTGGSKVDPNQTIPMSTVECTYKNGEFIGRINMGTFMFYEGKWLVWFSGYPEDDRVDRQMR